MDLKYNHITELPDDIGDLTELEELDLYENRLRSLSPRIGRLHSLRRLDLAWNRLTSLPIELGNLADNLQVIHIKGNRIPEQKVKVLKMLLPLTEIVN